MALKFSIEVKGNIELSNILSVKLCVPYFSLGLWKITVSSVSYHCKQNNLNGICQISTNFLKGQRYSSINRIEIYNPIIATVLLKADIDTFNVFHLEPNWFTVNDINEVLELKLEHFETSLPFLHDCFISINILLEKVK